MIRAAGIRGERCYVLAGMPATVLIVDDEKNIRRTIRMVLEGEGFGVE